MPLFATKTYQISTHEKFAIVSLALYDYRVGSNILKGLEVGFKKRNRGYLVLEELISAADVARIYGLHENTVKEAIKRNTVFGMKIGRDYIMLKEDAKKRWDISGILTDGDWERVK